MLFDGIMLGGHWPAAATHQVPQHHRHGCLGDWGSGVPVGFPPDAASFGRWRLHILRTRLDPGACIARFVSVVSIVQVTCHPFPYIAVHATDSPVVAWWEVRERPAQHR